MPVREARRTSMTSPQPAKLGARSLTRPDSVDRGLGTSVGL
jgi:hypothetical protein